MRTEAAIADKSCLASIFILFYYYYFCVLKIIFYTIFWLVQKSMLQFAGNGFNSLS